MGLWETRRAVENWHEDLLPRPRVNSREKAVMVVRILR